MCGGNGSSAQARGRSTIAVASSPTASWLSSRRGSGAPALIGGRDVYVQYGILTTTGGGREVLAPEHTHIVRNVAVAPADSKRRRQTHVDQGTR
jgi:hypothetical protein